MDYKKLNLKVLDKMNKVYYQLNDKKVKSEEQLFIWIKKFEVHKRFYEFYDENKVKIVNSPLACLDTYLVFAECLLFHQFLDF